MTSPRSAPPGPGVQRRLPIGAEPAGDGAHFRVWAPDRRRVEVRLEDGPTFPLEAEEGGYFAALLPVEAGARYRFRLDGDVLAPDPASRFQPDGPFGPSELVDPAAYSWSDAGWGGLSAAGQVLYELHVGTFTPEGTWHAARERLADIAELGVTAVEVMPVPDFPGDFGWGYDGVDFFAPARVYGRPDDFRSFVDAAHALGMGVILDVVYNHFGPAGNFLPLFARAYASRRHRTDWGAAINFDGEGSGPVREFFVSNARYWIEEYHLDGYRFDATQSIHDDSHRPILAALTAAARDAAGDRSILLVAENEPQHVELLEAVSAGGCGIDALWNDDFHHSAVVALTGRREAYYTDYRGSAQELVSAAKHGFLYQGQHYAWQRQRRGSPTRGLRHGALVNFLENHDQVANSERGERLHRLAGPGPYRAMTALLLLMPGTPLLFQGQEYGSTRPFLFFADHEPDLAGSVRKGRAEFLRQFRNIAAPEIQQRLAPPHDPATFTACKLDPAEREANTMVYRMHQDLLRLRRREAAFGAGEPAALDGAVLSDDALVLRFFDGGPGDRLLLVNLGPDLHYSPAPEPLLAPPPGHRWRVLWSSESAAYGGRGTAPVEEPSGWRIPGQCAVVLEPTESDTTMP